MRKIAFLLALMFALTLSASAKTEPLLLEPLSPTVLSNTYGVTNSGNNAGYANKYQPQVSVSGGIYEATYTPILGENMVPQNAVAEGRPAPAKRLPRVKIQTKQRSQGNAYWNPGGKGTKAYF